ncbi:MAG: peptide chain release factor 2 [Chloroflexi bacterium]|nr:peptide chain release factor 2 [Chloroflexota bacterium]MBU1749406.1 peptide chain release factor 2 [Chloroflexota bacterium]MBU1879769.1 peptide chain release factor 2 [Chloroflexota bacterium]
MADKQQQIAQLEEQVAQPDLWNDPNQAQDLMRSLSDLKYDVDLWTGLATRAQEALDLLDLTDEEDDESLVPDIQTETLALGRELDKLEFRLLLSGPYDKRNAIMGFHAGAGGTDAQDWAEMIQRMYLRWADRRGFESQVLSQSFGEEAGIKSAIVEIVGGYAYGYLRAERGVHRLVRQSPFNADRLRQTSFALVEVWPEVERDLEVEIRPEDISFAFFRSSGPGGQHMQKNDTAVRLTHHPTGIVISCESERSQLQNREAALRVLRARLLALERRRQREEQEALRGEHISAEWGNQMRSYVLHPYSLVKDHRTDYETSNTVAVLDGDLDAFIEAYLQSQVGELEP